MTSFKSPAALVAQGLTDTSRIGSYGDALWWTACTMTTGATSVPVTAEGRFLGWLHSLYGLGVFGYLTATLAGHFVGDDRAESAPLMPDRTGAQEQDTRRAGNRTSEDAGGTREQT